MKNNCLKFEHLVFVEQSLIPEVKFSTDFSSANLHVPIQCMPRLALSHCKSSVDTIMTKHTKKLFIYIYKYLTIFLPIT